jgi:hypothetical protein
VGANREKIVREARRLLDDESARQAMSRVHNPYGDGKAAQRIRECLLAEVNLKFSPTLRLYQAFSHYAAKPENFDRDAVSGQVPNNHVELRN